MPALCRVSANCRFGAPVIVAILRHPNSRLRIKRDCATDDSSQLRTFGAHLARGNVGWSRIKSFRVGFSRLESAVGGSLCSFTPRGSAVRACHRPPLADQRFQRLSTAVGKSALARTWRATRPWCAAVHCWRRDTHVHSIATCPRESQTRVFGVCHRESTRFGPNPCAPIV